MILKSEHFLKYLVNVFELFLFFIQTNGNMMLCFQRASFSLEIISPPNVTSQEISCVAMACVSLEAGSVTLFLTASTRVTRRVAVSHLNPFNYKQCLGKGLTETHSMSSKHCVNMAE